MRIALLGWGSLLWELHPEFDKRHHEWLEDGGPSLKLEFSRVSSTRNKALTLILDEKHGDLCPVAYSLSKRSSLEDAICDLRCREGTTVENIGAYRIGKPLETRVADEVRKELDQWAAAKKMDAVIWTNLANNFEQKSEVKRPFSVENAIAHLQKLDSIGKAKAAEYVWKAPAFVNTPLRRALQVPPWFAPLEGKEVNPNT